MAKSPKEAMAQMAENLSAKTGKAIDEWVKIAAGFGPLKHSEVVARLKSEYGLGHGYANMVTHTAHKSASSTANEGTDFVAAQYAGPKVGLKPIYDKMLQAVKGFGGDVDVSPKKTYVSLRRNKQFAIIQPSTATRVDVGLNLKGVKPAGRLEASGSFNAMVTHRVRLESAKDVNAELTKWLRQAYDAS